MQPFVELSTPDPTMGGTTKDPTFIPTYYFSRTPTYTPTDDPRTYEPTRAVNVFETESPTTVPTSQTTTVIPTQSLMGNTTTLIPTLNSEEESTNPKSFVNIVPKGCATEVDSDLPSILGPLSTETSANVLFPIQDSYVRGGVYEDENYGTEDIMELKGVEDESYIRKLLIEFDLSSLSSIVETDGIFSASLRLYVDSVDKDFTRTVSVYKLSSSIDWNEEEVTWNNFGTPPVEMIGPSFRVTWFDENEWIDVDITDLIEAGGMSNLVLVLRNTSNTGVDSKCAFASRETCYSPKLVLVNEPI